MMRHELSTLPIVPTVPSVRRTSPVATRQFTSYHRQPVCADAGVEIANAEAPMPSARIKRFIVASPLGNGRMSYAGSRPDFPFSFFGFVLKPFLGKSSPKMTDPFEGRLRTAVTQSVGAGCWSGETPSIHTLHIPCGGL